MPHRELTDPFLKSLVKRGPGAQVDYFDTKEAGLVARINQSSTVTFFVRYRFYGDQRRDKIDRYPTISLRKARLETKRIRGQAAKKEDPRGEQPPAGPHTFGEVARRFLEEWAKSEKRSWREDERILDKDLLPAWRNRPMEEIRRRDILALLKGIKARGAPVMANRTHALVHKLFRFAVDEEIIELSPAANLPRVHREKPAERTLSDEELHRVWTALDADPSPGARALQCLALVGQRRSEVTGGSHTEITEPEWWQIPGGRTKNGKAHLVYLVPLFREQLDRLAHRADNNGLWFPGRVPGKPLRYLNKVYLRARRASGVEFSPKDFRATFTTGLSRLGFQDAVKSACLNHSPLGVTQRHYDKWNYAPEKREAFTAWASHLQSLL